MPSLKIFFGAGAMGAGNGGTIGTGDDVQFVIAGTVGATDVTVVHTGGTAVQAVITSSTKVVSVISGGEQIRITQS